MTLLTTKIVQCLWSMNEYGVLMVWMWQGTNEVHRVKHAQVCHFVHHKSDRLAWDQTWAPMARGQWLTAWATVQPPWLWTARKCLARNRISFWCKQSHKQSKYWTPFVYMNTFSFISARCFLRVIVSSEPNHFVYVSPCIMKPPFKFS